MADDSLLNRLKENKEIIRQLCSFSETTRIPLKVMNSKGDEIWQSGLSKSGTLFCRTLRSFGNEAKICRISHKKGVRESIRWGEAIIGSCCYSLMQMTAPVMNNGKWVGYLAASPFLLVNPSDLQPDELPPIREKKGEKGRFEKALSSVPIIKDEDANRFAQLLFHLADQLSNPDLSSLLKIREIQQLQGKIADQIRDLKTLGKAFDANSLTKFSLEEEKEIIARIRLGDRPGAKEILYRCLAILLTQYLENFELLKISILELLIVLSRAAAEAGAKIEEMLGMKYRFVTELAKIKDQENLCLWVVNVLEKLMDRIYQTRNAKNFQRLKKAFDFIEANCNQPLTVEQIARQVCLSPSRLSHIIQNELGSTWIDYLSKMRVDRAKGLLKDTELPISQIALDVGYPDQSYFTKVFKKVEKCTPKTFRQKA